MPKRQLTERPNFEKQWSHRFNDIEINYEYVIRSKVVTIKDNKLAETNFKILNGILPCGVNLIRWKKATNSECSICEQQESISHMLCYR